MDWPFYAESRKRPQSQVRVYARRRRRSLIGRGIGSAAIAIAYLLLLAPKMAPGQSSDWKDGAFVGDVADLFKDQRPAFIVFVRQHEDLTSGAANALSPCAGDDTDSLCHLNQTRFVLDYIAAFYGDHISQTNVAYFLSGEGMPPFEVGQGNVQVGISPDPVWGCAWRIAILTSGGPNVDIGDLWGYKSACESMPLSDQMEAATFAQTVLTPQIRKLSAHPDIPFALVDDYPLGP